MAAPQSGMSHAAGKGYPCGIDALREFSSTYHNSCMCFVTTLMPPALLGASAPAAVCMHIWCSHVHRQCILVRASAPEWQPAVTEGGFFCACCAEAQSGGRSRCTGTGPRPCPRLCWEHFPWQLLGGSLIQGFMHPWGWLSCSPACTPGCPTRRWDPPLQDTEAG